MKHIEFVEWRELPLMYNAPWWDKPRWWLVRALGGQCPHDTVKVIRVPVDGKTFMDRLWKQKRVLFDQFHREPATLLIGGEDFKEVMSSPDFREAIMFRAEFNYGKTEVYGLTVKVIPWMRGMVVMP